MNISFTIPLGKYEDKTEALKNKIKSGIKLGIGTAYETKERAKSILKKSRAAVNAFKKA